jgi:hypothetical protein
VGSDTVAKAEMVPDQTARWPAYVRRHTGNGNDVFYRRDDALRHHGWDGPARHILRSLPRLSGGLGLELGNGSVGHKS